VGRDKEKYFVSSQKFGKKNIYPMFLSLVLFLQKRTYIEEGVNQK